MFPLHSHVRILHALLFGAAMLFLPSCASQQIALLRGDRQDETQLAVLKIRRPEISPVPVEIQREGSAVITKALSSASKGSSFTSLESLDGTAVQELVRPGEDPGHATKYSLPVGKHRIGFMHSCAGKGVKHAEGPGNQIRGVMAGMGANSWVSIGFELKYKQTVRAPVYLECELLPGHSYDVETDVAYGKCAIRISSNGVVQAESVVTDLEWSED